MGPQEHKVERRLAAIFAADVEGYSRLMGVDEVGTLRTLTAHRESMDRLIGEHGGRIANTAGDSVLAEFPSVVEAVQAAVEVQEALRTANEALPDERQVRFRVGVHLGDVMIQYGDLFGEGVNIAARLQALAEPGGVCISGSAHEHIRKVLPFAFEDLGSQHVKNIAEPVRAFAVRFNDEVARTASQGAVDYTKPLPLPDKPSIAVLPFTNMSADPEQEYFGDGVVEDIITALSRVRWFFVIARNSSFTYKGRAVDVRQVGRELGVRYVLEGSIRKAGSRVRITGQLIEAATGRHIWADRFDGEIADIFDLQDRVTESVVGAIEPHLRRVEIERASLKPTDNLDAYDLNLRASAQLYTLTKEGNDEALRLLGRALELDPHYTAVKALAAYTYMVREAQSWANPTDVATGLRLAREAWADHRDDPSTLRMAAHALAYLGRDFEAALTAMDRALSLNVNSAQAYGSSGWIRYYVGDWNTSIDHFQKAIRLSPLDLDMTWFASGLCWALLGAGRAEEALTWANRAVQERPTVITALRSLIIALVALDRLPEARVVVQKLLALDPNQTVAVMRRTSPQQDPVFLEKYLGAMRAVGIPE
jgi:adenylate cyclase